MGLFKIFIKILNKSSKRWSFWIFVIIMIIINTIPNYFLNNIINKDVTKAHYSVKLYIIIRLFVQILNYFYKIFVSALITELRSIFNNDAYERYSNSSIELKEKETAQNFRRKILSASWAVGSLIDWGLPTSINVITATISTIWLFYEENMFNIMVIIIISNYLIYYIFIKNLHIKFINLRNNMRKQGNKLHSNLIKKLPELDSTYNNHINLVEIEMKLLKEQEEINKLWEYITLVVNFSNNIPLLILLFVDVNITYFLLLINIFGNFTSSLAGVMGFLNHYSNLELKYNIYKDIYKN